MGLILYIWKELKNNYGLMAYKHISLYINIYKYTHFMLRNTHENIQKWTVNMIFFLHIILLIQKLLSISLGFNEIEVIFNFTQYFIFKLFKLHVYSSNLPPLGNNFKYFRQMSTLNITIRLQMQKFTAVMSVYHNWSYSKVKCGIYSKC